MRSSAVAVVALTLGGTLACSAADPLAPPAVASSLAAQRNQLDISGGWITSAFSVFDWLPGAVPDMDTFENLVRCESYAIEENLEWNSLILKRQGVRVIGTSRPEMGIQCFVITPEGGAIGWFVDIDASFDGVVAGNEVRLALNKYISARVQPDLINGGWAGTIRVRLDPRPYAAPYWIEQPFTLRSTAGFPCWLVHLDPPYCTEVI